MRSFGVRHTPAATVIVLLACKATSSAADPQAEFRYNEQRVVLTDAVAYQVEPEGSETPVTVVAFADFELDRRELADEIDTRACLLTQANASRGNVVIVSLVSPDRCDVFAYLSETAHHIGLGSEFPARLEKVGPSHVTGDCATASPGKIFDNSYEFRLPFDLNLTSIPEATRLGPGGGEPGRALVALVKAIQAKDWAVASRHLPKKDVSADEPRDTDLVLRGLALNYPSEVEVTDGLIKGERALLAIKGKDKDGKKIKGTFVLLEDQGTWRVRDHALFFDF